ncbi:hypothetical protein K7W42_06530 [Deinococcus sp. HMF7604]|uniref:hypothetical protein n=1 Tax=Deinococcus betulae TaxID=2873312 RepID=UPI001CD02B3C|nr:hypothetical protein [Deinococcus betulae]MBZ9750513.1 hypothetical protein [Deinococcus betulae]
MAGLETHCPLVQGELHRHVAHGEPLSGAAQAHLRGCAECRAELALLRGVQAALLAEVPAVAPPPAMRAQVLARARRPARRWWPAALSAAAAVGALLTLNLLGPSRGVAGALPDPAVVVSAGRDMLVASNDHQGTLTLLRGGQVQATLTAPAAQTPWFTEGVRLGGRVFLADAANDRVLELTLTPLRLTRTHRVPDGVAGLTADSGAAGGRVYFKSVRGAVGTLDGAQVTLAREAGMPLADAMDGVLLLGGHLLVTHHLRGEVCVLDPDTLAVRRRLPLGGMPVALAAVRDGVLVLDVQGRLLRLRGDLSVAQTWAVGGHPDKLSVNGDVAVLTDRSGAVTRVPLRGGPATRTQLTHPMDVEVLPDGTFAVAEGGRGLRVLDGALQTQRAVGRPPE